MKQPNAVGKVIEGLTVSEEDAGSIVGEDSLLHLEALLVVASSDSKDVALPLITEGRGIHLHAHALLIEGTNLERKIVCFYQDKSKKSLFTKYA